MTTTTANLGLFKYVSPDDHNLAFNIQTALNNNWDLLDNAYANIMSSNQILAVNGYIKFNSGFLINWGQTSTGTQEVSWTSPSNLTSDGTWNGNSFAILPDSFYSGHPAYHAFDTNTSTYFQTRSSNKWLKFYNPSAVKVTSIIFVFYNDAYASESISLEASNDDISYTVITSQTSSPGKTNQTLTVSTTNFYNYYKINFSNNSYIDAREITINGKILTTSSNQLYFPCAFSNTDYAYSLAYLNGVQGDSCATSLTQTYMSLRNNSNATTVKGIAVGY